ncbi:NAD(P)H-dependent oxidoreductase [Nocardia concava]|uniref:NAD(P)H-dependent oxidoreductase n=1 Tax=Nocardia concava TaxID=257281 RepID=UPI0002F0977E|nr:NADPH-dependent FMN reductase [Nocardia concava]
MPIPTVLAIPGSLRSRSFNRAFLGAVPGLLPFDCHYRIFDGLGEVPLYSEDIDVYPDHPGVAALRAAVTAADGVIIASPEYNQSIPGVLKNALDWLSRPHGDGALRGKAVLPVVVTLSRGNGARGLADLNRVLSYLGNIVLYQPEIVLASAPSVLRPGADGTVEITDAAVRAVVTVALEQFGALVHAGAAAAHRTLLDTRREVIERARFAPMIREALGRGAPPVAVIERLRNAGVHPAVAAQWIAAEGGTTPAAQPDSRAMANDVAGPATLIPSGGHS